MRARKIDANQNEVVAALRRIPGCSVAITSMVGQGFPDLVVGYKGRNYLIELKDGSKPPSARKLTPDEERFHQKWTGDVWVCKDINEVLQIFTNPKS
jgi:hypothetical protein